MKKEATHIVESHVAHSSSYIPSINFKNAERLFYLMHSWIIIKLFTLVKIYQYFVMKKLLAMGAFTSPCITPGNSIPIPIKCSSMAG